MQGGGLTPSVQGTCAAARSLLRPESKGHPSNWPATFVPAPRLPAGPSAPAAPAPATSSFDLASPGGLERYWAHLHFVVSRHGIAKAVTSRDALGRCFPFDRAPEVRPLCLRWCLLLFALLCQGPALAPWPVCFKQAPCLAHCHARLRIPVRPSNTTPACLPACLSDCL